jgi:hypothetical protein
MMALRLRIGPPLGTVNGRVMVILQTRKAARTLASLNLSD